MVLDRSKKRGLTMYHAKLRRYRLNRAMPEYSLSVRICHAF